MHRTLSDLLGLFNLLKYVQRDIKWIFLNIFWWTYNMDIIIRRMIWFEFSVSLFCVSDVIWCFYWETFYISYYSLVSRLSFKLQVTKIYHLILYRVYEFFYFYFFCQNKFYFKCSTIFEPHCFSSCFPKRT